MKVLVFAHTPPPHHGQSYMVKLMLEGFGGDQRRHSRRIPVAPASNDSHPSAIDDTPHGIECYHVDARFSSDIADMGGVRIGKFFLVFRYAIEAIWCHFRYGIDTFYFVPAPPKRPALYRDWLVMLICRPFFRRFIHHWHAAGLGDWLHQEGAWLERAITRVLLGKASLGVALATPNLRDPLWLEARHVEIVPNGIVDPFPNFLEKILPRREAARTARKCLLRGEPVPEQIRDAAGGEPRIFRILYLAYCFREKGIFETLAGVARAEARLREEGNPLSVRLTVAGDFVSAEDRAEFNARIAQPDLQGVVTYAGFVQGREKSRLLMESDCLCFPTYYHLESFGLVVLEAMAAGLNVIATRWRALPEILPAGYPGFVDARNAQAIAEAIPRLFIEDSTPLRTLFLTRFTDISHLSRLRTAVLSLDHVPPQF